MNKKYIVRLGGKKTPNASHPAPTRWQRRSEVNIDAARQTTDGLRKLTLQLLADELVALEVVDSISHETVRQTLKKTG